MKLEWMSVGILALATFVSGGFAQQSQEPQHAPTIEVCKADVAVWWTDYIVDQYENSENELASTGKYLRNPAGDLPITEVSARMNEMHNCARVDAHDRATYTSAWEFYYGVAMERWRQFVVRHGMRDQFMKEDAEGLR